MAKKLVQKGIRAQTRKILVLEKGKRNLYSLSKGEEARQIVDQVMSASTISDPDVSRMGVLRERAAIASPLLPPKAADLIPMHEGPQAVRAYLERQLRAKGVTVDEWIDTLEDARTNSEKHTAKGTTYPDHRTRIKATEIEMGMVGIGTTGRADPASSSADTLINVNISADAAPKPISDKREAISSLILRARAIAAGATSEAQIDRYVSNSPTPVIPDSFLASRDEAENILSSFTPVLPFVPADEVSYVPEIEDIEEDSPMSHTCDSGQGELEEIAQTDTLPIRENDDDG